FLLGSGSDHVRRRRTKEARSSNANGAFGAFGKLQSVYFARVLGLFLAIFVPRRVSSRGSRATCEREHRLAPHPLGRSLSIDWNTGCTHLDIPRSQAALCHEGYGAMGCLLPRALSLPDTVPNTIAQGASRLLRASRKREGQ